MRVPNWLEKVCQKVVDKYDDQNELKSRSQAFGELVKTDLELMHLKFDLHAHGLHPDDVTGETLRAALVEMRDYYDGRPVSALRVVSERDGLG